jgi:hypothetical protein
MSSRTRKISRHSPYSQTRKSSRLSNKNNKVSNELFHKYGFTLNQYKNYIKNKTNNAKRRKKSRKYNKERENQEMSNLLKRTMIHRPHTHSPKNPFMVNKHTTLEDLMKMLDMK